MAGETTIPALPCRSITETLEFYRALGFEVTYQQSAPNVYAVVRRGGIEIHFFVLKGLDPEASYSTCLVMVPDIEELHEAFASGLRGAYGKLPVVGRPRLARLKKGGRKFNVIDPSGNWIRFFQHAASPAAEAPALEPAAGTRLSRAVETAALLGDSKGDPAAAAKVLDAALARNEPAPPAHRVRALVARAELAATLGDPKHAGSLLAEARRTPLLDEDREELSAEFQAADELEEALRRHEA